MNIKFIESELLPVRITKVEIVSVDGVIESLEGDTKMRALAAVPRVPTVDLVDLP